MFSTKYIIFPLFIRIRGIVCYSFEFGMNWLNDLSESFEWAFIDLNLVEISLIQFDFKWNTAVCI